MLKTFWNGVSTRICCSSCGQGFDCVLQSSISETPKQQRRRRRLTAGNPQPPILTDPGVDGVAIGLDGNVYSDTALTEAEAQVGQLGPLNPKVAVCHFPANDRSQFQVSSCIFSPPP